MGQKYRLLTAALLVMASRLLILDEPGAQLDPAGLLQLKELLERLKKAGIAVLLCEHRPDPLLEVIDEFWQLSKDGQLSAGRWPGKVSPVRQPTPRAICLDDESLLDVEGLAFQGMQDQPFHAAHGVFSHAGPRQCTFPICRHFAGLLAGSAALFMGFAKAGPLVWVQYLAVAVLIDGLAWLLPGQFRHFAWSSLTGALAGASKFFTAYAMGYLTGMYPAVNLQRSLLEGAGSALFGLLAGALLPVVLCRLRAYGVIV